MCSMPNKCKLFVVTEELIIPSFYGNKISQAIKKQVRNVMGGLKIYSPAGRTVWQASAWLESPIAVGWWCHWPWLTMVVQTAQSAECSWQHKLLRRPLSGSQMGCCIQISPDLGHSRQTSLQETETDSFKLKKNSPGKKRWRQRMWKTDRHTDRQKLHKGFLILLLAHTLFTSSCAPKVLLKTGVVEKSWRENKKLQKK